MHSTARQAEPVGPAAQRWLDSIVRSTRNNFRFRRMLRLAATTSIRTFWGPAVGGLIAAE
jgi:hypothetical protein